VNGHFIREKPLDELYELAKDFWPPEAAGSDADYKKNVLALVQERLKYLAELPELTDFFFKDLPIDMNLIDNNKQLKKFGREELREMLVKSYEKLEKSDFSQADLTQKLNQLLEEQGQKPGVLFSLIRVATTWAPASPGLAETLSVLGKTKSLARLRQSQDALA
jgi:glutamyl/glutaminyl-tRNA synthetase